jgi:hypothetical protein
MNQCVCHDVKKQSGDPLAGIVQTYLENNAAKEDRYLHYYRVQRSLPKAISKAAMAELPGGKRFSHQRRIPKSVLTQAKDGLLAIEAKLASCRTFDELHQLIEQTIRPIRGIGELVVYDTAHRLGAFFGLSPEFVYLHAGARTGALALGLKHRAYKLPMSDIPKALQKLKPEQVEDCLCIYKARLRTKS